MGRWIDDPTCPSGFRYDPDGEPLGQQPATTMLPVAHPPRTFIGADGATYTRAPASEFESYDNVDSRSITDPGAPD